MGMLTSLLITLLLGHFFISKLNQYQIKQIVRTDGPKTHLKKQGTPTMGGLIIIFSFILSILIWSNLNNQYLWIIITTTFIFGLIGFIDDYLKIKHQSSNGMSLKTKLLSQFIGAVLISIWLANIIDTDLLIPFIKTWTLPLGLAGLIILSIIAIIGSSNAVNMTDGLDGLAIMPVVLILGGLAVFSYIVSNYNFSNYLNMPFMPGTEELFVICAALIGSGIGFLWFNAYPAEVFMGDVGSLSLGAIIAVIAIMIRQEILFIIMSGVLLAEILSVMIQVSYFKMTKKRVFLMAPIHHHFEKKGLSEPKIIIRFWMITLILVLISLLSIKIR
jgi:phospho-N-acetylmuramoyl-pentapeptide-transferase